MPIWTLERNFQGSAARRIAVAAPRLPLFAMTLSRAGLDDRIASSDMTITPLTKVRPRTTRISKTIVVAIFR